MGEAAVVRAFGVVREEAERFIAALAGSPDAPVTFQTFDNRKRDGEDGDRSLAQIVHGTLDQALPQLQRLNARGAGIYVMVNEGDGKGRGKRNVTGLRALFVDDDKGQLDPEALAVPPSIVVRSKAGPHVYWLLKPGEKLDDFTPAQAALAAHLGTDTSIKDLPRVLRVPGFLHQKDPAAPFPVRLDRADPVTYTINEVLAGFGINLAAPPAPAMPAPAPRPTGGATDDLDAAATRYDRDRFAGWPASGSGTCPVCGDRGSFGRIPDSDPPKWSCFSTDHQAVGRQDGVGIWWGGQLDLDAHAAGLDRVALLRREGFLEDRTPRGPRVEVCHSADRVLRVGEIFAPLPPVSWICQPLDMAPGAPTLIAGYGFSGKTVAAQDFALACATGTAAWGRFPVRAGRVLHIDYEQGEYLTRLRYQRIAAARGIDPRGIDGRLEVRTFPPWYLDNETDDFLARLVDGFDICLFDSFRAACPATEENASEARVPLDRLTRLSERTGTLSVVLHHARKPSQEPRRQGGGARMAIRGSGAIYDACGSVLVFSGEKGEPVMVEHDKARITGRTHDDFRLWIEDVDTDAGPESGLRVSALDAPKAEGDDSSERLREAKARVLTHVQGQGGTSGGVNVLCEELGGKRTTIAAAVAELVREGLLTRGGTAKVPTLSVPGTT